MIIKIKHFWIWTSLAIGVLALTWWLVPLVMPGPVGTRIALTQPIQTLSSALELYKLDTSQYPTTEQGLEALTSLPTKPPSPISWNGPYIKKLDKDQWGNAYQYRLLDNGQFEIFSLGADNKLGGSSLDAELSSNDL